MIGKLHKFSSKYKSSMLILLYIILNSNVAFGSFGFSGNLYSVVRHTPENQWFAGHRLQLYSDLELYQGNAKAYVVLGGWLPTEDEYILFGGIPTKNAKFLMKQAYVEIDSPFEFAGLSNLKTVMGNVVVDYSPYVIQLNRRELWNWEKSDEYNNPANYNGTRNGLTFDLLKDEKAVASNFLIWEGTLEDFAYGGQVTIGNRNNINLVYVSYIDKKGLSLDSNQKYNSKDNVYLVKTNLNYKPFTVESIFSKNENLSVQSSSVSDFKFIRVNYKFTNLGTVIYEKWNMDQLFDPQYRDRTPKYDPYTGKKLNWNPVDRLAGTKGDGILLNIKNNNFQYQISNFNYDYLLDYEVNNFNETSIEISGKLGSLSFLASGERKEIEFAANDYGVANRSVENVLFTSLSYPIANTEICNFELQTIYLARDNDHWDRRGTILLNSTLKEGTFQGANLFLGHRKINSYKGNISGVVCGLSYMLGDAVNLVFNYAKPNDDELYSIENKKRLYDEFGNKISFDNIFEVSVNVSI